MVERLSNYEIVPGPGVEFSGHSYESYSFSDEEQEFNRVDHVGEDYEGQTFEYVDSVREGYGHVVEYWINDEEVNYEEFRTYADHMLSGYSTCLSADDVYGSVWEAYDEFEERSTRLRP